MIYITGDMHNTIDMSNISTNKLKNYYSWQKNDYDPVKKMLVPVTL